MSKFKVGDRVRALANPTSKYYSNAGYFNAGEEFTVEEVFPPQDTVKLVERDGCWSEERFELVKPHSKFKIGDTVRVVDNSGWQTLALGSSGKVTRVEPQGLGSTFLVYIDGPLASKGGIMDFRLELVEEVKPAAPAVPQLPGIPEGYRAVRIGTPAKGEWYIDPEGDVALSYGWQYAGGYVILGRIDQPAPVEPVKPAEKVAPVESPDDLVIQDRVPAREGVDFGWWVAHEKFDSFVPKSKNNTWEMSPYYAGNMHGFATDGGPLLAVMCYRKDLPAFPTTERVLFTEYICWDIDGPKTIMWTDSDPLVETGSFEPWDHAHPTGNTREIEVPVVKP